MNKKETNVSLFFKLILAVIKGDDAEATAIKIQKKAIAALTAQIAAKVYHTLTLEDLLEAAEVELGVARVNGGDLITDNDKYIRVLLTRKMEFDTAVENLNTHKKTIKFLEEELSIAQS